MSLNIQEIYLQLAFLNQSQPHENIYKSLDNMCISARSLGDLNVQLVMERLGGGGHQSMAACQMEDVSMAEARERLVSIINDLDINKKPNVQASAN